MIQKICSIFVQSWAFSDFLIIFLKVLIFFCVCVWGGDSAEWFIVQIFFILPKCFAYENSRRLIGWKFLQTHSTINGDLREQRSFSGV